MKLFVIEVDRFKWDCSDSIAILAESKDEAIKLACEWDDIFVNNITCVEEIDINEKGIVLDSVRHG